MASKVLFVAAVALVALPAVAAEQSKGFYLGAGVGAVQPLDSDISGTGISAEADYDPGFAAMGMAGFHYGNGFRTELELGHSWADIDTPSGDTSVLSIMLNGLYDFRNESRFTPYLGLGVGGANVNFSDVAPVGTTRLDDDAWTFAYQGIAGVSYAVNNQWDLFADYRYLGTIDSELTTASGRDVDAEYSDHRIMIGFRFNFGAPPAPAAPMQTQAPAAPMPPPAAAPMPPPAPAAVAPRPADPRTYLVFFEWDSATLSPDALAILRTAADNAKRGGVSRIESVGHADRSGPDPYNDRLSQRRAQAVKAELVRLGVTERDITVASRGEREPLVPTQDGVREPQNRRVEILFK